MHYVILLVLLVLVTVISKNRGLDNGMSESYVIF